MRIHAWEPFFKPPVGVIATRLAYTQESGERNLHGRPFSAVVRQELLRRQSTREIGFAAGSIPARFRERFRNQNLPSACSAEFI